MGSGNGPRGSGSLSRRRFITFTCSILVALGSGTNYVFSAYAPQLGSRLGISHTQLNVIGLMGNVGVYGSGPLWGNLVDRKGPKLLFFGAFTFLLVGYSGMRYFYDATGSSFAPNPIFASKSPGAQGVSIVEFCVLAFCTFLTGLGGNAGVLASMNATAKSFSDQTRGTTTGIVLSGFGLSAFLFSTMAHVIFPGDTSSFLLVLALGTSLPMVAGFFFVRPVPPLPLEFSAPEEGRPSCPETTCRGSTCAACAGAACCDASIYEPPNNSRTNLLSQHNADEASPLLPGHGVSGVGGSSGYVLPPPPEFADRRLRNASTASADGANQVVEVVQELHGKALLTSWDFWLIFGTFSLLTGTGLMYINNVGSITHALLAKDNTPYDKVEAAKLQSAQVSMISIANCLGRIITGLGADFMKNTLHRPRSYCMSIAAALFVLSQIAAAQVEDVHRLWAVSALLGLAFGGTIGLFPTLCIEWFGLVHFSENWGYLVVSPMVCGNLFNIAFGRNLDRHTKSGAGALASPADKPRVLAGAGASLAGQCFGGRQCYVASLYMTTCACVLALALSVYAGRRDWRRMAVAGTGGPRVLREDIWEEDEEN